MKKFFVALCLILAFAMGTLVPLASAFEIPSFIKDIKIYDVTENQVFLEIYGQVYVWLDGRMPFTMYTYRRAGRGNRGIKNF